MCAMAKVNDTTLMSTQLNISRSVPTTGPDMKFQLGTNILDQ